MTESRYMISFGGDVVSTDTLDDPEKFKNFDLKDFIFSRNGKEKRYPEMVACAKALKSEHGFKKLGAIGFCYGGWAVFKLGGKGMFIQSAYCVCFLSNRKNWNR